MIIETRSGSTHRDTRTYAQSVTLRAESDDEARLLADMATRLERDGLSLSPDLGETLLDVRERGPVTAARLHGGRKRMGVTAFNNRLEDLRRLGFLTRRKVGRVWEYYAVEAS